MVIRRSVLLDRFSSGENHAASDFREFDGSWRAIEKKPEHPLTPFSFAAMTVHKIAKFAILPTLLPQDQR